jgi:hypothetical protein
MLSSNRSKVIAAGIAAVVIGCGAYGTVAAVSGGTPSAATASTSGLPFAGGHGTGAKGSNARTTSAEGGTMGTVSSMSSAGFTVSTSTSQKVTVKETSATSYENGTSPASVSAVTSGEPVLVLGVTDSTTITAAQVIVRPPSGGGTSPGGKVIPKSTSLQGASDPVGQIPSDYTQGSGALVSSTTADKAIEAALAGYPGGVVDRVVALGNGDYEVHNIGVSWPHHIFVNADFKVIGANS